MGSVPHGDLTVSTESVWEFVNETRLSLNYCHLTSSGAFAKLQKPTISFVTFVRTYALHNFFFRKSCHLRNNAKKIWWIQKGHRRQYGAYALHAGFVRLRARTHARTWTQAQKYVILIAFPRQQRFCKCASMSRDSYFASLVNIVIQGYGHLRDRSFPEERKATKSANKLTFKLFNNTLRIDLELKISVLQQRYSYRKKSNIILKTIHYIHIHS